MKTFMVILGAFIFVAVCVHGQDDAASPNKTTHTQPPTTHSSPTTTPSHTSKHTNPTTSAKQTKHTQVPITTTGKHTSSPTTTTKPTEHTTQTPKPTTHENPTTHTNEQTTISQSPTTATMPVTTPVPAQQQTFSVKYPNSSHTCILINTDATFNFTYNRKDNKTGSVSYGLQNNTKGNCGNTTQQIEFPLTNNVGSLTWVFFKNESENQYYVKEMTMKFKTSGASFPDIRTEDVGKNVTATNTSKNYVSSAGQGYRCKAQPNLMFESNPAKIVTVFMKSSVLVVQAFRDQKLKPTEFSNMQSCAADRTSNIVPIAVGAALAGLVIIVLIAYLIGRRRNKKGYESV